MSETTSQSSKLQEQGKNSRLLASFQNVLSEIPDFVTDAQGQTGFLKYGYLTLTKMLGDIKPVFAKYGLGFYQSVSYSHDIDKTPMVTVDTFVFSAESGESMQVGAYPILMTMNPQENGKRITYARRYALYSALGIYPEQDDDARTVAAKYNKPAQNRRNAPAPDPYERKPISQPRKNGITKPQADELTALARGNGINLMKMASQYKGHDITRLRELTQEDAKALTSKINELREEAMRIGKPEARSFEHSQSEAGNEQA